jgi:hypothetical protein
LIQLLDWNSVYRKYDDDGFLDAKGMFCFEIDEDVNWTLPENIEEKNFAKAEEMSKTGLSRVSMEEDALRKLPGYVKTRLDDALEAQTIPTSAT